MSRADDPFDTYLMRVLCALVAERSVSRTAIKLNQSQPAVSAALKRLRVIFDDPLLVRGSAGMVPTERGLQVSAFAREALASIDKLLAAADEFVPATTRQAFRIGSPDYLAAVFMAKVVAGFRRDAPESRMLISALGPD